MIVCVVDGQSGALPDDVALVRLLMRTGKPLVIAVNKLDVPSQDALLADFHRAGVAEVIGTSAAHRRGITELLEATVAKLPDPRHGMKGGVGTASARYGDLIVGAVAAVNALGRIVESDGSTLAANR